jgi:hypothetical protein
VHACAEHLDRCGENMTRAQLSDRYSMTLTITDRIEMQRARCARRARTTLYRAARNTRAPRTSTGMLGEETAFDLHVCCHRACG